MTYFSFADLPFSSKMSEFWQDKGYIVIENFYSENQCNQLIHRSQYLIENNVFIGSHSVIKGGAIIGHHSVVAAGTIVEGEKIKPYSLIIGNPMLVKSGYYKK